MPEHPFRAYEPVLSSNAAAFLVEQSKGVQRSLFGLIGQLAKQPGQSGSYSYKDSAGRTLQVAKVGKFTFSYWADDPVKELRIVEISIL